MNNKKTISKEIYFEAAHLLPNHEKGCKNLHGHSYKFKATISGPSTEPYGMIMDYTKLKQAMEAVAPDHMYLHFSGNEISEDIVNVLRKYGLKYMTFSYPTSAENMAPELAQLLEEYIHNELGLKDVTVEDVELHETHNSACNTGNDWRNN